MGDRRLTENTLTMIVHNVTLRKVKYQYFVFLKLTQISDKRRKQYHLLLILIKGCRLLSLMRGKKFPWLLWSLGIFLGGWLYRVHDQGLV